jgi:outer membrane receptor protein involved in Fe transport
MVRLRDADDAPYVTNVDADVNASDLGMWIDAELRPLSRVTLRGGLRADALAYQIDDRVPRSTASMAPPRGRRDAQGVQLGPRAAIEVDLGAGFLLSAAYGKGFRSPQALSLGEGENAPFATVHAGEVGARARRSFGSATLVGFATHVDRDLVFDPTIGQNVVNEMSAATTRLGVAAIVRATPIRGVEVVVSGTWSRATYDASGLRVPYVPPLVGRLDAAFVREVARPWNRPLTLSAGVGLTALGTRPLPFSESSPPVAVLDAGLSVRLAFVELALSARNLTNTRWRDGVFAYPSDFDPAPGGSRVPVQHFTAGRPFTLLSSLTFYL